MVKVLVVDHVKLFQQIIASIFDAEGLIAVQRSNGRECLQAIEEEEFAFICVSLYLQDTDGIELCRQIRAHIKSRFIPVILFTSESSPELQHSALSAGITEIFLKQQDLTELTSYIKRFTLQYQPLSGQVLYVEDNKALRLYTLKLLQSKGLHVDSFTTAEQAWRAFNTKQYDLLITDIVLGGKMSGIWLVNKIRRLNDNRGDISILAMSGFDDMSRRIELFHLGVNDYVTKPIFEDEFLSRIRYLVGASRSVNHQVKMISNLFSGSLDGILVLDHRQQVIDANAALYEMSGYAASEILNRPVSTLFGHYDHSGTREQLRLVMIQGQHFSGEMMAMKKNGVEYPAYVIIYTLKNSSGVMHQYIMVIKDISQQKAAQAQILYLESHDALTGLKNRTSFHNALKDLIDPPQIDPGSVGLLWLDLLHFKELNSSDGYQSGDMVLKAVANRLKNFISCGTVYRITGDEFAVIYPQREDPEWLLHRAAELLAIVEEPIQLPDKTVRLGANLGISSYPKMARNRSELVAQAEAAMNFAKSSRSDRIQISSPELNEAILRRQQIINALHNALANEEFFLVYQPQYSSDKRQMVGVEALIRWHNPQLGMVGPDEFIPLAEVKNLMPKIGDWIIDTALREHQGFLAVSSRPLRLSINISPVQLERPDFCEKFIACIQHYRTPFHTIEVEVTESTLIENFEIAVRHLSQLRERGISVALDDFGTGYSSFAYLKKLPIDCIKIDKSFVEDLNHDADNQAVVLSSIDLARHFHLRVIAEGIEVEEQATFLFNNHCHELQGYCFSRPIRARDLIQLLT